MLALALQLNETKGKCAKIQSRAFVLRSLDTTPQLPAELSLHLKPVLRLKKKVSESL